MLAARQALDEGVNELDMVINIGAFLSGDHAYVENDVRSVVEAARPYGVVVKGIIECYYLTRPQRLQAARIVERAGAGFREDVHGPAPRYAGRDRRGRPGHAGLPEARDRRQGVGGCFNLDAILLYYRCGAGRFGASETANILEDLRGRIAAGTLSD